MYHIVLGLNASDCCPGPTHTGRQAGRRNDLKKRFLINDRLRKNRLLTELLEIGSPMSFAFDHTWDSSPCGTTHFDVYHFVFIWFRFYVCLVFTTKLFIGRTHFFLLFTPFISINFNFNTEESLRKCERRIYISSGRNKNNNNEKKNK